MQSYTLYELLEFIRRVLALNVPKAIWVVCEIAQCNESRGHYYLNLIEKQEEDGDIVAKSEAVIWQNQYRQLKRKLGKELDNLLQEGVEVKLQVRVDFHERYGFKIVIEDIDPIYTLGKLELQRRKIIEALQEGDLLGRNEEHPLPAVIQRVALISSKTAAGYADFINQLSDNVYGYHYDWTLFPAAMQGQSTSIEIRNQLKKIRIYGGYDCVVITRGGGARLDLMAFDDFELCKTVAEFQIPVLTGLGHETDDCLLDLVAHTPIKTPTAVAEFLISHNMRFESMLLQLGQDLFLNSQNQINNEQLWLEEAKQVLRWQSQSVLNNESQSLTHINSAIKQLTNNKVRSEQDVLHHLEELNHLLSTEETLRRGYSLTIKDGKILRDTKGMKKGEQVETQLSKGKLISEVIELKKKK